MQIWRIDVREPSLELQNVLEIWHHNGEARFAVAPEEICDYLNTKYDWTMNTEIIQVLGHETMKLEREFNRLTGFIDATYNLLCEWMTKKPFPSTIPFLIFPIKICMRRLTNRFWLMKNYRLDRINTLLNSGTASAISVTSR